MLSPFGVDHGAQISKDWSEFDERRKSENSRAHSARNKNLAIAGTGAGGVIAGTATTLRGDDKASRAEGSMRRAVNVERQLRARGQTMKSDPLLMAQLQKLPEHLKSGKRIRRVGLAVTGAGLATELAGVTRQRRDNKRHNEALRQIRTDKKAATVKKSAFGVDHDTDIDKGVRNAVAWQAFKHPNAGRKVHNVTSGVKSGATAMAPHAAKAAVGGTVAAGGVGGYVAGRKRAQRRMQRSY